MARLAIWCAALAALLCTSTIALAARVPSAAHRSLKDAQEQQDTKFFPFLIAKHALGGGLTITITKGGTGTGTGTGTSTNDGGPPVPPIIGKGKAVITFDPTSGNPTVVTPDKKSVPVPQGHVIIIIPPSTPNGSPGVIGPKKPDGSKNPPPANTITVWNPDQPGFNGQPGGPVIIAPNGIPMSFNPSQPSIIIAWPQGPRNPPDITSPDGDTLVLPQVNLDCSDMVGTYTWDCDCSGRCKSAEQLTTPTTTTTTTTTTNRGWYPLKAVVASDCSVQLTTVTCDQDNPPVTGPAQVYGDVTSRSIVFPRQMLCFSGLQCPEVATFELPGFNQHIKEGGLDCRVSCQPSKGLPKVRDVLPVTPQPPIESFKDIMLNTHNRLRDKHGAQPLHWDDKLARDAQAWADKCTGSHDNNAGEGVGENMHGAVLGHDPAEELRKAVEGNDVDAEGYPLSWYGEGRLYKPSPTVPCTASPHGAPCHFTQVVWKSADRLGCGFNPKCINVSAIVCRYAGGPEPGNSPVLGAFERNVSP